MDWPVVRRVLGIVSGVRSESEISGEIAIVQIVHVTEIPADLQQVLARNAADIPIRLQVSSDEGIALLADAENPVHGVLREKRDALYRRHARETHTVLM